MIQSKNKGGITNNEGENNTGGSAAIINNNVPVNNDINYSNDCCNGCCSYKPNTYENGLYNRDINPLTSFLFVYAIISTPGYFVYEIFDAFKIGSFIIAFANVIIVFISLMWCCVGNNSSNPRFIGYGFIIAGVIYILIYIVFSIALKNVEYSFNTPGYFGYNIWIIQRQTMVGIGLFIGSICLILGAQLTNNIKYMNSRRKVIRVLLLPLLIYSILIGPIILNTWVLQTSYGYPSFILAACCIIAFFVIGPYSDNGGCNCLVGLGTVMWVEFMILFVQQILWNSVYFSEYQYVTTNYKSSLTTFVVIWTVSPILVAAGNLWVLLKALHPCLAKCNDKNIERSGNFDDNDIELQVKQAQQAGSDPIPADLMKNNNDNDDNCCGECCPGSKKCGRGTPFAYENGLYSKDIRFFIAFIVLFVALSIYQEISLKQYETFKIGGYMAFGALIVALVACLMYLVNVNTFGGGLFIVSGVVYGLGYILSGIFLKEIIEDCPPIEDFIYTNYYGTTYVYSSYCYDYPCAREHPLCQRYSYSYYNNYYSYRRSCNEFLYGNKDCWAPQRPYFIARGLYIAILFCIIGIQIFNKTNNCCKGRVLISKILMLPMIIYCIFIGSIVAHDWGYQIVYGCMSFALGISLMVGLCVVNKKNNNGKCGMVVYGGIMWGFYIYSLGLSLIASIAIRANNQRWNNKYGHNAVAVLFWELSIMFISLPNMVSILRAIHPNLTRVSCDK